MKKTLSFASFCFAAIASTCVVSSVNAQQQLIAFWDFNDGFDLRPDEDAGEPLPIQIVHGASLGAGTLYQQRAEIDGNGKDGNAFSLPALGINVADGQGIAWDDFSNSGDNDAEFFGVVSTAGFENIEISFDFQGNDDDVDGDDVNTGDGFTRFDIEYSLLNLVDVNPLDVPDVGNGLIKDFQDTSSDLVNNFVVTNSSTEYQRVLFSVPATVNNQSVFAFRLNDFNENDSVRFDNVLVTGTVAAIPEPSSLALLGVVGLSAFSRRRRS